MDIIGIFTKNNKSIKVDNIILDDKSIVVYIKGTIFNIEKMCLKYGIHYTSQEQFIRKLYQDMKTAFVSELDGNFAIIIYDKKLDKLYLIKDKLGSVFIYYYYYNNNLIFSTSLKLLTNQPEIEKKINRQALANFLGYTYIYEPFTIFENIYKLEKGTILIYQNCNIQKENYYNLYKEYCNVKKIKKINDKELIDRFNDLFYQSISKCGNKKSQVGVFMSSGKDSTFIAKIASDYFEKKVNTYTLGFENERDESAAAAKIANHLKTNHHSILLHDKDVKKTIQKIPLIYEEPFADPSIIPNIYMTEHIKDKNDFYLTGEGNDAIFIAGSMYRIYDFKQRIKLIRKKLINIKVKKRVYHNFSEMAQVNIINRFNYSDKIIDAKGKVYPIMYLKEKRRRSVIGDLTNTVSERYRVKTGSLANYHNYQYYTPFYEPNILLETFAIPTKKIYYKGKGKQIFEQILYSHIDKKYYETYKKNGFGIPLVDWVKRMMLDDIKKISTQKFIKKQNLFDYQELSELINSFENQPNYNKGVVLWCYYVFQLWYKYNIND